METRILAATLALLATAGSAAAGTTWYGLQLGAPLPAAQVGDAELGCDVGLTATEMHRTHVGSGVDLVYHYWPASAGFKAAYDHRLLNTWRVIDGPAWAFSAIQTTGHVKLAAPLGRGVTPWTRAGMGLYSVNRNLTGLPGERLSFNPGWYVSAGFDFERDAGTAVGLDATFHHLFTDDIFGADFTAFTLGAHVLYGGR